jgi:hypothetical protein
MRNKIRCYKKDLYLQNKPATLFAFPFHFPKPSYATLSPGMKFRSFTITAKTVSVEAASVHAVAVPLQKDRLKTGIFLSGQYRLVYDFGAKTFSVLN